MIKNLKKLLKDDEGATAVEYGLIVAAIAGLIIVVVFLLGNKVNNAFSNVAFASITTNPPPPLTTDAASGVADPRVAERFDSVFAQYESTGIA